MSQRVVIDLPDDVYCSLAEEARAAGKTAEAVAAERVIGAGTATPAGYGRLRRLAGGVNTGLTDLSTRHHEYLGEEADNGSREAG